MESHQRHEARTLLSQSDSLEFGELEPKPNSSRSSSDISMAAAFTPSRLWTFRPSVRQFKLMATVAIGVVVASLIYLLWNPMQSHLVKPEHRVTTTISSNLAIDSSSTAAGKWIKPEGFKIVGLVFCMFDKTYF
jgi:hypothetical protein